jgi:hypothetical protein
MQNAEGQEIKLFVIGVVLLLGLFLFFMGRATAPKPHPPVPGNRYLYRDYLDHGDLAAKQVDKLAVETHGDISKVSPDDRDWLERMTGGHGADLLRMRYRYLLTHNGGHQNSMKTHSNG